ncbi:MAG: hypothetical protein ABJH04_07750 [Cyclobacteriaceae bacterium]
MKVIRERILNAVHKCLEWKDGEITGIDMMKLEQRIDGILQPNEQLHAISTKRPQFTLEEITETIKAQWVKDFGILMDDDTERDGYFICGFVHEALKAACDTVKGGSAEESAPAPKAD